MPNPFGIPLKCPKRGYPLTYVRSEGKGDIYQQTHSPPLNHRKIV